VDRVFAARASARRVDQSGARRRRYTGDGLLIDMAANVTSAADVDAHDLIPPAQGLPLTHPNHRSSDLTQQSSQAHLATHLLNGDPMWSCTSRA